MFSVNEVKQLRDVAQLALGYETELDRKLKTNAKLGVAGAMCEFPSIPAAVASYLAEKYQGGGWVVTVRDLKNKGYSIDLQLPPEPKRGGPDDR